MESQPQNPKFRNNPENFHPCDYENIRVVLVGTSNKHYANVFKVKHTK